MSTLKTQPQVITVSGKSVSITEPMGITKISVEVKSGSVTVSGAGSYIPAAIYSSNNAVIASTDASPVFTFGGNAPIDGLTIDVTSGSAVMILSSN